MPSILIVEDDKSIQQLYQMILNSSGFKIVDVAQNGQECVEKYKTFSEKPDLILMDYRMPIKDGIQASVEILEMNKQAKIIFATADEDVSEKAKKIGITDILKKPFEINDMINAINSILNQK